MSITSSFSGKAAKKAIRVLDNKFNRLEKALTEINLEGTDKILASAKKLYAKERLELTTRIAEGKVKEEEEAPAKKKAAPSKKKAVPAKKARSKKAAPAEEEDTEDPLG